MSKYPSYETRAADCAAFMRRAYPGAVKAHTGAPFIRPAFTNDRREYSSGFYWGNGEADRFYFDTENAAAADICQDMGVTVAELDGVSGPG
jgi:hypothetical protein